MNSAVITLMSPRVITAFRKKGTKIAMDQKGPFKKGQFEDPIIATTSPEAAICVLFSAPDTPGSSFHPHIELMRRARLTSFPQMEKKKKKEARSN